LRKSKLISDKKISDKRHFGQKTFRTKDISDKRHFGQKLLRTKIISDKKLFRTKIISDKSIFEQNAVVVKMQFFGVKATIFVADAGNENEFLSGRIE
jgi:hypothetical protein